MKSTSGPITPVLRTLGLVSALALSAGAAQAAQITVMSWGGTYTKSQVEAYYTPFTAKTGINVVSVDSDNPAIPVKAQVEAGNVTTDVVDIEYPDAIRLCDEGLLEPIDPAGLPAAPDGTPATEDFLPNALAECAVGLIVFSTVYAYDTTKITADPPTTIADFFDTAKYPGKRGLKRAPKALLEMALMGDGVPADEVYKVLGTPRGGGPGVQEARHHQEGRRLVGIGRAGVAVAGRWRGGDDHRLQRPDLQRDGQRGQAVQDGVGRTGV